MNLEVDLRNNCPANRERNKSNLKPVIGQWVNSEIILFCFVVLISSGKSDPYCIVKVDNEVVARYVDISGLFFCSFTCRVHYTMKLCGERKMMLFVGNISKFFIKLLHRSYRNAIGVDFTVRPNTNKHERLISPQNSIMLPVGKYQLRLDSCCNLKQNLYPKLYFLVQMST